MLAGLLRFVILRVLGGRALLALAVVGWVRNRLRSRPPRAGSERGETPADLRRSGGRASRG
jgi:hypothetical protein